MMVIVRGFFVLAFFMLSMMSGCSQVDPIAKARKVFKDYVDLSAQFDEKVVDLYSDRAEIQNTRVYPNGEKRVMKMEAKKYKALLKKVLPLAKLRKDTNGYEDVAYVKEGNRVVIKATRISHLKGYASPMVITIGEDQDGEWRILREYSQSKP